MGTALLWAVSPLQWSQALITEVYALHMLLAALLAWTLLAQPQRLLPAALVMALGLANHLTFTLLLPAAAYWLWRQAARPRRVQPAALAVLCGASVLTLLYATIPRAAGGGESLPPVNWGYPDQWSGLWWLVSGAAYRRYMAAMTVPEAMTRLTGWARLFVQQYTVVGLLVAGWGLAAWDRHRPELRNFSLLWALPISVYALVYATYDSQVYLLPATWMLALWLASGLAAASLWLPGKLKTASAWPRYVPAALALVSGADVDRRAPAFPFAAA